MPQPVGSQVVFVNGDTDRRCSNPNCSRGNVSKDCKIRLCSKCCGLQFLPCGYTAHDKTRAALSLAAPPSSQHAQHAFGVSQHAPTLPVSSPSPLPTETNPFVSQSDPTTSSSSTPASTQAAPATPVVNISTARYFAAPMDDAWRARWEASMSLKEGRLQGEASQREHKRRINNSAVIQFYAQDHTAPTRIPFQGIPSFPYFCPSQQPAFLEKSGLGEADEVERYIIRGRFWQRQPINESFTITSQQVIIFRRVGVKECADIDFHISLASGQTSTTPSLTPSRPSKRAREDSVEDRRAVLPRSDISHASPHMPSPFMGTSSWLQSLRTPAVIGSPSTSPPASSSPPSPSSAGSSGTTPRPPELCPSPVLYDPLSTAYMDNNTGLGLTDINFRASTHLQLSLPAAAPVSPAATDALSPGNTPGDPLSPSLALCNPLTPCSLLSPLPVWSAPISPMLSLSAPPLDDLDALWDSGHVYVPEEGGIAIPWVDRVYARDMAKAFALIGTKKDGLAARFEAVFPGLTYISSTWHRQQHAWRRSTEEERQYVARQPRTPAGLWKVSRRSLSAWKTS